MQQSPKKKVTLYFNSEMLEETQREALRQDRSISWIIQAAWRLAREEVHKLPAAAMSASQTPVNGTDGRPPAPRRAAT